MPGEFAEVDIVFERSSILITNANGIHFKQKIEAKKSVHQFSVSIVLLSLANWLSHRRHTQTSASLSQRLLHFLSIHFIFFFSQKKWSKNAMIFSVVHLKIAMATISMQFQIAPLIPLCHVKHIKSS